MDLKTNSKYILDTTVFIDALRGEELYKKRARWIMFQSRGPQISAGYSVVTELELWRGIRGFWTDDQHERLIARIRRYPLLSGIARRAGKMRSGLDVLNKSKHPGILDCVIAATAEYYGLTIVTRNKKDYELLNDNKLTKLEISDYSDIK